MYLNKILLLATLNFFWSINVWPCHKGGPMGFATNDPGGFSLDITLSPTYTGASTLGTLNCKNWDYAFNRKIHFLQSQWPYLNEEASRGEGINLVALSQMVGCSNKQQKQFKILVHENFSILFGKPKPPENFFNKLEVILLENSSNICSG